MKKRIISLAVLALVGISTPATAFAANTVAPADTTQVAETYAVCTVENCNAAEVHQHDCDFYAGHTIGDGHTYHQICSQENCTKIGNHDHNGTTYFQHHNEDGHTYHKKAEHHNTGGGHNGHGKRGGHHH